MRIQFQDVPGQLFGNGRPAPRNELVIRIQPNEVCICPFGSSLWRALVLQAIYFKLLAKQPGFVAEPQQTELDLTYKSRFVPGVCMHNSLTLYRYRINLPEAYDRLICDVVRGDHSQFVRSDEVREAWRILTPLLHGHTFSSIWFLCYFFFPMCSVELEAKHVEPLPYVFGSRGPQEADVMTARLGYVRAEGYEWPVQEGAAEPSAASSQPSSGRASPSTENGSPHSSLSS